jgi:hypothetical protein
MGDGIRPKGAKSYAAMRSPEAMKAHQKDIADGPMKCPECGGEMEFVDDSAMVLGGTGQRGPSCRIGCVRKVKS